MVRSSVLKTTMATIAQYCALLRPVTLHVLKMVNRSVLRTTTVPSVRFVMKQPPLLVVMAALKTTMVLIAQYSVMPTSKRVTLCATRMEILFALMDIATPQPTVLSVLLLMDAVSYAIKKNNNIYIYIREG